MKLIIDIPENAYKATQWLVFNSKMMFTEVDEAIANGTPYEERPKGKWIIHNDYNENCRYGCDQCGNLTNRNSSFCPDCGADMRGDKS